MKKRPHRKYRFPRRAGNRFRLLVDGGEFYDAMLESIRAARHYVLLEMYLFESGSIAKRFIEAFVTAAKRGVDVFLLLDGYGAWRLLGSDRMRLRAAGVKLEVYNPLHYRRGHRNLFRNHRKLLLVDGRVAYTGGAGISDQFDPELRPLLHWHETMIEIQGANVDDWQSLFVETWSRWSPDPLELPQIPCSERPQGDQPGRVVVQSSAHGKSEVMRSFVNRIRYARSRVWLATAYFVPAWKLRRALRRSARRGVDVRLMLPGPRTDHPAVRHMGCRHYERMLRDGVRIFEYQPRFLHAKILLCDQWLSLGSSNLDRWTYRWNLEANQELVDPRISDQVQALFEADFSHCREVHYADWTCRPWSRRLWERVLGQVAWILSRFSDRKNNRAGPGPLS